MINETMQTMEKTNPGTGDVIHGGANDLEMINGMFDEGHTDLDTQGETGGDDGEGFDVLLLCLLGHPLVLCFLL